MRLHVQKNIEAITFIDTRVKLICTQCVLWVNANGASCTKLWKWKIIIVFPKMSKDHKSIWVYNKSLQSGLQIEIIDLYKMSLIFPFAAMIECYKRSSFIYHVFKYARVHSRNEWEQSIRKIWIFKP